MADQSSRMAIVQPAPADLMLPVTLSPIFGVGTLHVSQVFS